MGGVAAHLNAVELLTHLFGVVQVSQSIVGRVKLDAIVAHLRHLIERAGRILVEFVPHGIQFQPNRYPAALLRQGTAGAG